MRAPVNSFEFHRCRRTPQVAHLILSLEPWPCIARSSEHRLRRGLPGYLILFATHALAHQRQIEPGKLPSLSGFQVISKHFTATSLVPPPSSRLQVASFNGVLQFSCSLLPLTWRPATRPLNPINPDNARILRITAAAGTELADAYSSSTGKIAHVQFILP